MKRCVTHLIIGLGKGGAETMLYQMLLHRQNSSIEHKVLSLGEGSYYEEKIRDLGIEVEVLRFKKRPISTFFKLRKRLKGQETLCCWMYHANFIGYIIGKLARVPKIIWNVRHSDLNKEYNKSSTLRIVKWCAKRSQKVHTVAYNGIKAKEAHEAIGYCKEKSVVLENGVDTNVFCRVEHARETLTAELGIPSDSRIILSVARYHPIKDVPSFVKAFAEVHTKDPNTVAVMCGNGIDTTNTELTKFCTDNGLTVGKDVYLLGLRHDLPTLFSACDLYVLHSASEAFPNTLVQAMACECLCVATDVGDSKRILSNTRLISPARNAEMLAEIMQSALSLTESGKNTVKLKNRNRVSNDFSINNIVKSYERIL